MKVFEVLHDVEEYIDPWRLRRDIELNFNCILSMYAADKTNMKLST